MKFLEFSINLLSCIQSIAFVYCEYAYSHDSGINTYHPNWMKYVSDNTKLKTLSLPGTHDSLALHGVDSAKTQSKSLRDQLYEGVRVFDVRCRHICDTFPIYHGFVNQDTTFNEVLRTMVQFLDSFPSEVLLVRVKQEYNPAHNHLTFEQVFRNIENGFINRIWVRDSDEITVGRVRGKIIILDNFSPNQTYGLPYSSFIIQDNYHLRTNWDLYSKWESVRDQLNNANNNRGKNYYMNYLSGCGYITAFPYFVASGHSSPQTNAPRLLTGLTTPGWKHSYPEFPRVSCFIGICSIAFEGTNTLATNYIKTHQLKFVGIIMADFPGSALINTIIGLNF